VTLTNSFYEGNTHSLQTMGWAVRSLEAQTYETYRAKLALVQERKRSEGIQQQFVRMEARLKEREEYARDPAADKAELVLMQRQALEESLKGLSEEVEELS
jgi:predicted trehalose synthase